MIRTLSRRNFLRAASWGGATLTAWPSALQIANAMTSPFPGKYQATGESLSQYNVPDWFRDAKFGAWTVWGPYAVPAYGDE